ncbi:hypothetical protein KFJ24_05650 [Marinobacter sediminum]|uniref:hypothetical protein n=1 Tax=Marinobacter sediminum TaxID=256323 RepID=UPI002030B844|nr:hypothetical protein [Marinobacter sediminum]MCM0611959.1 hypothetical protein [Marinobacter sediminum]
MSDSKKFTETHEERDLRENRKFSVSSNRGRASHRVRYVEAGGAAVDMEDCTLCQAVPELSGSGEGGKA